MSDIASGVVQVHLSDGFADLRAQNAQSGHPCNPAPCRRQV